jgi:hypothetical protein
MCTHQRGEERVVQPVAQRLDAQCSRCGNGVHVHRRARYVGVVRKGVEGVCSSRLVACCYHHPFLLNSKL